MPGLNDWLLQLQAASKGGVTWFATRGRSFAKTLVIAGDYSGASLRGQVRRWPDSAEADDPLASFTFGTPTYDAGADTTSIAVSLTTAATAALDAAPPRDPAVDFVFDLLLTPSGGSEELLLGGVLRLLGRVTE